MVCGLRGLPQFLQKSVATDASLIAAFRLPPLLVECLRFGSGVICFIPLCGILVL